MIKDNVVNNEEKTVLKLEGLNKIYDNGVQAVFDMSIDIKEKEFIVFVGPSGCGKSSTLRTLAGLEEISSGNILVDGKMANLATPSQRGVSMVFQNYALYPHFSVFKNIRFPLENDRTDFWKAIRNNLMTKAKILAKKYELAGAPQQLIDKLTNVKSKLYENKFNIKSEKSSYISLVIKADVERKTEIARLSGLIKLHKSKQIEIDSLVSEKQNVIDANKAKHVELKAEHQVKINSLNSVKVELKLELTSIKKELSTFKLPEDKKEEFLTIKNEIMTAEYIVAPYRSWKKANDEKVFWAADILGLADYIYRKPRDLSGGQRQRVALGRAIVRSPKLFMMDEPLSNLDAKLRADMRTTIRGIHDQLGAVSIYVTHDQVEAMTMASRIVVMKEGFVQQIGTPDEVFNSPSNTFVAGFIGSPEMNFIDGKLSKGKFISEDFTIPVDSANLAFLKKHEGKKIIMGVRPGDFTVSPENAKKYPETVGEMQIKQKEVLGKEIIFHGTLADGGKTRKILASITRVKITDDMKIKYSIRMNRSFFFDAESGETINVVHNKDTLHALDVWNKGGEQREANYEIVRAQKEAAANKSLVKKTIKLIKGIKNKKENKMEGE